MPKRTPVIVTDYRPKILAGSTTASGGAQTLIVHDINTSHSGNLLWSRLDKTGSSLADIVTRPHGALTDIGTNTHAQIDSHIGTADIHVAHSGVTLTAGNGLTGGGTIAASRTFAVGAGDGITVNADDVALTTPGTLSATTSNTASGNHTHAVSTGAASTLNATTANATGTSSNLARADHLHAITTGAASTLSATTANATGTSSSLARADHLHAISTGAASTLTVSTSNAIGTSSNLARADHLHTITTSSNPGATAAILASDANGGLGLLRLTSNSAFTSGFAGGGYRIDEGVSETGKTSAEFDNLTVRGRMRIYELLIQQIRATNGSMFVSSSSRAEVVTEDNDWYVNGEQLELNGVGASFDIRLFTIRTRTTTGSGDRNLYHGFLVNDILRAQRVDISTGGGLITRQVNLLVTKFVDLWEYDALLVSSDAPVVGDEMVRLGSTTDTTRQGSIYLTSDDSNAPFIDIVDEVASHAEWNQAGKIKARLGKLSGIVDNDFDEPVSGYGLYSDNVYLKGQIVVTGGNALVTGGAAADVNSGTTTIDGGQITTGTIEANRINVTSLAAINANLGSVTAGQIVVGDVSNKLWLNDANDGGLAIGGATKASAPFRVTAAGALTATNATIAGNITSTSGSIGGWTLTQTSLLSTNIQLFSGAANVARVQAGTGITVGGINSAGASGDIIFWGGALHVNRASAPFRVTAAGALTSTSGAIANWTIDTNELKSGSGFDTVGLRSGKVTTEVAIYAGNATPANAPFRVTAGGALTATSGAIGGWTIGPTAINSSTLTIDASGPSIRSGKSSYSDTTTGFWIGLDSSTPKFNFGSSTQYIRWSGTALEINRPTLSAAWTNATYNPDAEWDTYEDTDNNVYGHPLKYVRMGDFVFVTGWVKNTVSDTRNEEHATVTKVLPKPDGTQFIYARSNVDNSNTAGGYGNTFEIKASGNNGHLVLLVNEGGDNVVVQDLIINGWYKAAA